MAIRDFRSQRLHVEADLAPGARVELDRGGANYLINVLRMGVGDAILIFNGRDGEWRAAIEPTGRKGAMLRVEGLHRAQPLPPRLRLLAAPLKVGRLDYLVQKAVEMGVGRITPIITERTNGRWPKADKARAYAIEAAQQCGILTLPALDDPVALDTAICGVAGPLVFCDEGKEEQDPLAVLRAIPDGPTSVLIGPEGGFSDAERALLKAQPDVTAIALGPRILRADTAAVAALALVQAVRGDWRSGT